MNERIRKLAKQSGATLNEGFDGKKDFVYGITMSPEELEKFAELIVRECAKVCDDLDIDDWGDKSFDDGTYYCSRAIKQHFGDEE
jgi:hypothetical protein